MLTRIEQFFLQRSEKSLHKSNEIKFFVKVIGIVCVLFSYLQNRRRTQCLYNKKINKHSWEAKRYFQSISAIWVIIK